MTEDEDLIYQPCDVVYGADPFKGDATARPWVIVANHEGRPFYGDQYVALALTARTWLEGLIELEASDWLRGGTPSESRIVHWGVQSIGHEDVDYWQGRLDSDVLGEAVSTLVAELESAT